MRSLVAHSFVLLMLASPSGWRLGTQDGPRVETSGITSFTFSKDYFPGTVDRDGWKLSGSEIMRLTGHRGQLFAATSMFRDPWMSERYPGYTGAQVLRKPSSGASWEADISFGTRYLRVDALESVQFTHDSSGQALPEPVVMLVSGIWDLGPDASGRNRWISVAIRDDETGDWTISRIAQVPDTDRDFASVRAMKVHRDRETGMQYLFVGAANGGVFKGVFDPATEGRIRWFARDEVNSTYGRPQSMTVCNGSLYASFDYGGITVKQQTGGIFRRIDGEPPQWESVYRNYNPRFARWNQTARGITCVAAEDGSGGEVILTALESIPEPVVVRIEPANDHRAVTELNYLDLFTTDFGEPPKSDESGLVAAALNYMEPFENPDSGTVDRFLTTNIRHPRDPAEGKNGAYFLVRRSAARYDWGEIKPDPGFAAGSTLRGVRTIEKSPFPDEPDAYYFGGYAAGIVEPMQSNTAWIYSRHVLDFLEGIRTGRPATGLGGGIILSPGDVQVGSSAVSYLDPEFLQEGALAVFADQRGEIWAAEIDRRTGLFRNSDGKQFRIDGGLSQWSRYSNGPEWGLDANGPAIFYLKDNEQGAGQLWRAEAPWDSLRLTQLTTDQETHNWVAGAAVNSAAPSTRVIICRGRPEASGNVSAWADEDRPNEPTPFADPAVVARWAYNSELITFAHRALPDQAQPSQVQLVDALASTTRTITADSGNKIDPWLWQAPEFGGEWLLAVNIDGRAPGIYRDTRHDGSAWERIATITLPADAPHPALKSVEPVNGGCGAFGRSYFTVQAGADTDADTSIWIFGFDPAGDHRVRRLDDGILTGKPARRLDPESLAGERELFVYYTLLEGGGAQLRLCRTGIFDERTKEP